LYMQSSSEMQRVALSARHCLQIKCSLPTLSKPKVEAEEGKAADAEAAAATGGDEKVEVEVRLTEPAVEGSTNQSNNVDYEKSNGQRSNSSSEINTTIVSVEPETSFGDLTLDSIKDHLLAYVLVWNFLFSFWTATSHSIIMSSHKA